MTARTVSVFAGILAACATIYWLSQTAPYQTRSGMSGDLPPSTDDLLITISEGKKRDPPTINVSIHNKYPHEPLSLLLWDTPLDPTALNTGVLLLANAESGELIPAPELKLNRLLPPPRESLLTILPGHSVEKEIELKAPWVPQDGRLVTVSAQGSWRAVWRKREGDISDEELSAMNGIEVLTGAFKSMSDVPVRL